MTDPSSDLPSFFSTNSTIENVHAVWHPDGRKVTVTFGLECSLHLTAADARRLVDVVSAALAKAEPLIRVELTESGTTELDLAALQTDPSLRREYMEAESRYGWPEVTP